MSNAIDLYSRLQDPFSAIDRAGEWIAKACLIPGCDSPSAGKVVALACAQDGMSILEFQRTYHIIGNQLQKKALAVLAEFRRRGGKHRWLTTMEDSKEARIELQIEGQTLVSKFTTDDALRQGLVKKGGGWEKTPGNMLRARAITNGVAMLTPEIFCGDDSEYDVPAPAINLAQAQTVSGTVIDVSASPVVTTVGNAGVGSVGVSAPAVISPVSSTAGGGGARGQSSALPNQGSAAEPSTPPASQVQMSKESTTSAGPAAISIDQIEQAIGAEHAVDAMQWMMSQNPPWLTKGQDMSSLTPVQAKRIVNQSTSFRRAVCRHVRAETGDTTVCKRCRAPMPK